MEKDQCVRDSLVGCQLSTHTQLGPWSATQSCALTGNRTGDLSVHRSALSPLSHTSQGYLCTLKNKNKMPSISTWVKESYA